MLLQPVLDAAAHVSVRVIPACDIDRYGLHRSNLAGPARRPRPTSRRERRRCLVDGFRLGPLAPPHRAVVDGDTRSAAIAAASIVAKVTRDRIMRRLDALYPRYGFSRHVGYITPAPLGSRAGARAVRPAPAVVRGEVLRAGAGRCVNAGERRALWHYRLRGYRILGTNVAAGRNELDLIVRRGRG